MIVFCLERNGRGSAQSPVDTQIYLCYIHKIRDVCANVGVLCVGLAFLTLSSANPVDWFCID